MSSAVMLGKGFLDYGNLNDAGWKCPAVFFETKGNTSDGSLGQKANGVLTKQNYQAILAFLNGIASGNAFKVDPLHWYDIPAWKPVSYYDVYGVNPPFVPAAEWIAPAGIQPDASFDFLW